MFLDNVFIGSTTIEDSVRDGICICVITQCTNQNKTLIDAINLIRGANSQYCGL